MKRSVLSLAVLAMTIGCDIDKGVDTGSDDGFSLSDADADADSDADADADGDADADADADADLGPFTPVAIGLEWRGIWDEANDALLESYVSTDENGEKAAYYSIVTMTLATMDYFGATSDAEREGEYCTMYGYFVSETGGEPVPADLNVQEFDWEAGVGGSGTLVEEWAGWEGGIVINPDSVDARCYDWIDSSGASVDALEMFNGMHYGIALGDLSSYMTTELTGADWWEEDTDAYAYHTMYTAMNHPSDSDAGYNFIAYDFSSAYFVEADPESCVELLDEEGEVAQVVCGEPLTETRDDGEYYKAGNFNVDVGSRYGFIIGNAWWYEDFPNLDLSNMAAGFDWE